jgi:hypothetical protein
VGEAHLALLVRDSMDDCLICRKHRGEISIPGGVVYEDDLVVASHSLIAEGEAESYRDIRVRFANSGVFISMSGAGCA